MKKLLFNWRELKATFWLVPVIIILSAILLSIGLVYVDGIYDFSQEGLGSFFFVKSSDSARSILSTISTAMMGVAGTVFSITLVALTLASSQFGPRLIKNFMYVRLNQVVLGSYISTYLYCLLVLNAIREGDDYTFIPAVSILVAIIAAVLNIILLIVFIHQIAVSIQADNVISDISNVLSKQVKTLFPEKVGSEIENAKTIDPSSIISGYQNQIPIKSPRSGYLQYVDGDSLIEIITKKDSLLELYFRPGGHVVEGLTIGLLFSHGKWEKDEIDEIVSQLVVGKTKTPQQDLEFSIHQMVEIAAHALSTGVNDPYTAMACIDNLTATLSYLAQAKFPSKHRFDKNGYLRMIVDTLDFEGVLDAAFNQIRQYSGGSPAVIIRLMEATNTLNGFASNEKYRKAIIKHAEMVLRLGRETISEKNDLDDLERRAKRLLQM
jgi:uncharacterized membrane protein